MNRPRIGITTKYSEGRQIINYHYIHAIENAGGLPMIVPMLQTQEATEAFASMLDGLVMVGGPAITLNMIGERPDDLSPTDPVREKSDTLIYHAMNDKPMLGICYGMQFINAQSGGSIYADVMAAQPGVNVHSMERGAKEHPVRFQPDSHLRAIFGTDTLQVNSDHVQALASIGAGLRVAATSPDGVIEAIESPDGRLIGVQFHPELLPDRCGPLFEDFVARCRRNNG